MKKISLIFGLLVVTSCKNVDIEVLESQNKKLQKEVDSLKNELYKCDIMLEAYEGQSLNI
ncbi:hypothetical protein DZC72_04315 [Maribacter algicola]|uniref:Uncharacterized protein n=1 Tax=Maribacter algicola TaxID=2498892 RepID=A0A426RLI8_9FLAO|nr:hypothetical protein [Maribacter algicola]RRQ49820.1 hypothetical protein DZC72_04315 [Maribacter algicola]